MPEIFEDSVLIMAKAGTGMAMFSMGMIFHYFSLFIQIK